MSFFKKNNNVRSIFFSTIVLMIFVGVVIFTPIDIFAATTSNPPPTLINPLGDVTTLDTLTEAVIRIVVGIAWAIAAFFLILSGFRFVQAQGNPEKLKVAKHTFMYTIIGIVIIAASNVIITVLKDFILQVTGPTS